MVAAINATADSISQAIDSASKSATLASAQEDLAQAAGAATLVRLAAQVDAAKAELAELQSEVRGEANRALAAEASAKSDAALASARAQDAAAAIQAESDASSAAIRAGGGLADALDDEDSLTAGQFVLVSTADLSTLDEAQLTELLDIYANATTGLIAQAGGLSTTAATEANLAITFAESANTSLGLVPDASDARTTAQTAADAAEAAAATASGVAQVDSITISGTIEVGDSYTVFVNGNDVTQTIQQADLTANANLDIDDVRDALIDKINASSTAGATVLAEPGGDSGQITLTALNAGIGFSTQAIAVNGTVDSNAVAVVSNSIANLGGVSVVAQVDTVTLADTVVANHDYLVSVNGNTITVTADSTEVTALRTKIINAINANDDLSAIVDANAVSDSTDSLTLTADVAGVGFSTVIQVTDGTNTLANKVTVVATTANLKGADDLADNAATEAATKAGLAGIEAGKVATAVAKAELSITADDWATSGDEAADGASVVETADTADIVIDAVGEDDVFTATINGIKFSHTATSGQDDADVATALHTLIATRIAAASAVSEPPVDHELLGITATDNGEGTINLTIPGGSIDTTATDDGMTIEVRVIDSSSDGTTGASTLNISDYDVTNAAAVLRVADDALEATKVQATAAINAINVDDNTAANTAAEASVDALIAAAARLDITTNAAGVAFQNDGDIQTDNSAIIIDVVTAIKQAATDAADAALAELTEMATTLGVTVTPTGATRALQADSISEQLKTALDGKVDVANDSNVTNVAAGLVQDAKDSIDEAVAAIKASDRDASAAQDAADSAGAQASLASASGDAILGLRLDAARETYDASSQEASLANDAAALSVSEAEAAAIRALSEARIAMEAVDASIRTALDYEAKLDDSDYVDTDNTATVNLSDATTTPGALFAAAGVSGGTDGTGGAVGTITQAITDLSSTVGSTTAGTDAATAMGDVIDAIDDAVDLLQQTYVITIGDDYTAGTAFSVVFAVDADGDGSGAAVSQTINLATTGAADTEAIRDAIVTGLAAANSVSAVAGFNDNEIVVTADSVTDFFTATPSITDIVSSETGTEAGLSALADGLETAQVTAQNIQSDVTNANTNAGTADAVQTAFTEDTVNGLDDSSGDTVGTTIVAGIFNTAAGDLTSDIVGDAEDIAALAESSAASATTAAEAAADAAELAAARLAAAEQGAAQAIAGQDQFAQFIDKAVKEQLLQDEIEAAFAVPIADDDSGTVAEDSVVLIDVLTGDTRSDPDLTQLVNGAVVAVSSPGTGSVRIVAQVDTVSIETDNLLADPTVEVPNVIDVVANGVAIEVRVSSSDLATVREAVIQAINGSATLSSVVDAAEGSSANDISLESFVAGTPITTSVSINDDAQDNNTTTANGLIEYTPDADVNGTDTFTYTVSNNLDNPSFDTGAVTVTITPENDAPIVRNDFGTTATEISTAEIALLSNDSDIDGDDLTITNLGSLKITVPTADVGDFPGTTPSLASSVTTEVDGSNTIITYAPSVATSGAGTSTATTTYLIGTVVLNDDDSSADYGTVSFTPAIGAFQSLGVTADGPETETVSFDYTVTDGTESVTKAVTVTITGTNDAPVAIGAIEPGVAQTDTVTLEGTVEEDDVYSVTIDNVLYSYTATSGDAAASDPLAAVATGLAAAADAASGITAVAITGGALTLTGAVGETFVVGASTTDGGTNSDNDISSAGTIATDEDDDVTGTLVASDVDNVSGDLKYFLAAGGQPFNGTVIIGPHDAVELSGPPSVGDVYAITINGTTVSYTATITDTELADVQDALVAAINSSAALNTSFIATEGATDDVFIQFKSTAPAGTTLTTTSTTTSGGDTTNNTVTSDSTVDGFRYIPDEDYSGNDTFTFRVQDTDGIFDTQEIVVNIAAVNDAPETELDTASTDAESSVTIAALANDFDEEDDTLTITQVDGQAIDGSTTVTLSSGEGTVQLDSDGNLKYTPKPDAPSIEALADGESATVEFSYTVSDGEATSPGTVQVSVGGTNDAPEANNDTASVNADGFIVVDVLSNDTDAEVTAETQTLSLLTASGAVKGTLLFNPQIDSFELPSVPAVGDIPPRSVAPGDIFQIGIEGFVNGIATVAIVDVTITSPAPATQSAVHDLVVAAINADEIANSIVHAVNDEDVTLASANSNGTFTTTVLLFDSVTQQVVNVTVETEILTNQIVYAPDTAAVEGLGASSTTTDTISYQVSDGIAADEGELVITIQGINDAPEAGDDTITTAADDGTLVLDVLANDDDPDDNENSTTLDVTGLSATSSLGATISVSGAAATPQVTTVTVAGTKDDGDVYRITIDGVSYAYTVLSGDSDLGDVATGLASVAGAASGITAVATTGGALTLTGAAGVDFTVEVSTADGGSSADNTIAAATVESTAGGGIIYDPSTITSGVDSNGNAVTSIAQLAQGATLTDTITYFAEDGSSAQSQATVTITISGVNDPPVANDDGTLTVPLFTASENGAVVQIDVLENDTDPDVGDKANFLVLTAESELGATIGGINSVGAVMTYNPSGLAGIEGLAVGEILVDTITYTVSDQGSGGTAEAQAFVRVTGVNDAPDAVADSASAVEDSTSAVTINVLGNDNDVDSDDDVSTLTLVSASTTTPGATVAVITQTVAPQTDQLTVFGTIEAGDIYSLTVNGQTVEHKVTSAEASGSSNAENQGSVAENFASEIEISLRTTISIILQARFRSLSHKAKPALH